MLIFDFHTIGNKLYAIRKQMGMTQAEVAEAAGVSDRTYADIERGRNIKSDIVKKADGYEAVCTLLDGEDTLLEYRLFVPTQI